MKIKGTYQKQPGAFRPAKDHELIVGALIWLERLDFPRDVFDYVDLKHGRYHPVAIDGPYFYTGKKAGCHILVSGSGEEVKVSDGWCLVLKSHTEKEE